MTHRKTSTDEPILESDGRVTCHQCGTTYERPGYHWSNGSCDYPSIPDVKSSQVLGMMLGDGTLRTHTSSPFVQSYMINKPFLEWLDDQLAWLSTGVSLYRTAEHSAQLSRDNGYPDADEANYHDVFVMQTRTMPQFERYVSWYENSDRKQYPAELTLTPIDANIWYVCDGSLNWDRRYPNARPYATVGVSTETQTSETVLGMFDRSTFDHIPQVDENTVRFSVDETEDFLDWIGVAPDGFEYKWETDSLSDYEAMKDRALGDS